MTNINITPIIETVIGLIITIVSVIAIPKFKVWISNNLSEKQIEIAKVVISSCVQAAEQIYANSEKAGSSKKKYVMEYAKNKLAEIGLTIDEKEIEVYLEQAVLELKESQKDKVAQCLLNLTKTTSERLLRTVTALNPIQQGFLTLRTM